MDKNELQYTDCAMRKYEWNFATNFPHMRKTCLLKSCATLEWNQVNTCDGTGISSKAASSAEPSAMELLTSIAIPVPIQTVAIWSVPFLIWIFASFMENKDFVLSGVAFSGSESSPHDNIYDFIVVGGGSAGGAVTARLSENPQWKILLIEAGGDPSPLAQVPFASPLVSTGKLDWGYYTVPQNGSSNSFKDNKMFWPRGKSLGGSSNANFMIYMRGNPNDFDNWANITGDRRWAYNNVNKIYQRMENYHGNWKDIDSASNGKGGPLRVEPVQYRPGLEPILNAAKELGYPIVNLNSFQKQGFTPIDFTVREGTRFGTFKAYLKPAMERENLVIHRYSQATRIHFDEEKRAIGVTYFRHGSKTYAMARKEIILSAGAINSPQLLMLSGIGPEQHLLEHGIKPIVDIPGVGENLQDHVASILGPFIVNKPETFVMSRNLTIGSLSEYLQNGVGPLATPLTASAAGVVSLASASPIWPNMMYLFGAIGISPGLPGLMTNFIGLSSTILEDYYQPHMEKDSFFSWQTLMLPKSRGTIRLKDSNPFSHPLIDPNYYSDEEGDDIKKMVEGFELLIRLFENTTSLGENLGARLTKEKLKGCENFEVETRAYKECFLKHLTMTMYHPSGTCAMGKVGQPETVVDSELRVVGVQGLRVADASIMPQITNTNTNAPSIMIGEMCAEIIKQSWNPDVNTETNACTASYNFNKTVREAHTCSKM